MGDINGSLELALLLTDEPELASEVGQGERLLRELGRFNLEARYELGLRMLSGAVVPINHAGGFEHLLLAAEGGYAKARHDVDPMNCGQLVGDSQPSIELPIWAKPYQGRLRALFPKYSLLRFT